MPVFEHVHFPEAAIDRAVEDMRKRLRDGGDGSPSDACYVRLAGPAMEAFMRWQLAELNRGTPHADIGETVLRFMMWLLGQLCVSYDTPEQRLSQARFYAMHVLAGAGDYLVRERDPEKGVFVPGETGGRA